MDSPPPRDLHHIDFWRKNYFVPAGIHISKQHVAKLNPILNVIKQDCFGTQQVEIKSDWLRNPFQQKKRYIKPFGVSKDDLKLFTERWYDLLTEHSNEVQIQAFVLDKRFYKKRKHSPLQILTQVLFDRIERHPAENCSIVFDQMENRIHSEKNQQGEILKISDKEVNLGSFYREYSHVRPTFEKSRNSNFLQMADTVAYNVWRQFVNHGDWKDEPGIGGEEMYPYFSRILPNFYHKNGWISGIGLIKVPDMGKINKNVGLKGGKE